MLGWSKSLGMGVNWLGLWTLYRREVERFLKPYLQSFGAPVVTAALFLSVFSVAFEGEGRSVADIPFPVFLVPGLMLMGVMTNSFSNVTSSIMMGKIMEFLVDTLVPPLTPLEIVIGYLLASITRGLLTALAVGAALFAIQPFGIQHPWMLVLFVLGASSMLSALGLITAVWAEKYDQIATISNFVILPLTFLSGTFYSIQYLPEAVQAVSRLNPLFYAIDGARYGVIGHSDSGPLVGIAVLLGVNLALWLACTALISKGYKIKS